MISVCIIMKNEHKHIKRCLEALSKNGFGLNGINGEIVVIDTGSEDDSVDIANCYTDRVYHFDWTDDFAAAKNYALDKALNDYVLVVDADEYMTEYSQDEVEAFVYADTATIGRVKRNNLICADNVGGVQRDYTERLFSRKRFCFEGRIHEQVVPVDKSMGFEYKEVGICFEHDGYLLSNEELAAKAERNRRILIQEYSCGKNGPYECFQIAQSYMLERDTKGALEWFEKGMGFELNGAEEYVQMMVTGYGDCLLANGMSEKALGLRNIYSQMSYLPDFIFMMGKIYMDNNMLLDAYKEFATCLGMNKELERSKGVTDIYSLHNLGVINEMFGETEGAVAFYKKAASLGYDRSKKRLLELNIKI